MERGRFVIAHMSCTTQELLGNFIFLGVVSMLGVATVCMDDYIVVQTMKKREHSIILKSMRSVNPACLARDLGRKSSTFT